MKAGTILRLLKIGKEEHIRSLYREGVVFMKPLRYFTKVENNSQQCDNFEGATHFEPIAWLEITTPEGKKFKFGNTPDCNATIENGNMLFHPDAPLGNIYCMYAWTQELNDTTTHVDERNKEFGETVIVIHNPKAFLERVISALDKKGVKHQYGLVDYFDRVTYKGKLTPFKKRREYSHQSEFRIWVENVEENDFILEIGSIEDIAGMYKLDDISGIFEPEVEIEEND